MPSKGVLDGVARFGRALSAVGYLRNLVRLVWSIAKPKQRSRFQQRVMRRREKQWADLIRAAWSVQILERRQLLAGVTLGGIPDYQQQGPMPSTDNGNVSFPLSKNEVAGAVSAIAPDPFNSNRIFIATINGGIFRATDAQDGRPFWEALTDQFPSLSTRSLMMSPLSTNVLFAGLGRNSSSNGDGGTLDGMLRTTDGGTTWKLLGQRFFNRYLALFG